MHDYLIRMERAERRAYRRELLKCAGLVVLGALWFAAMPFLYELIH